MKDLRLLRPPGLQLEFGGYGQWSARYPETAARAAFPEVVGNRDRGWRREPTRAAGPARLAGKNRGVV